MIIKSIKAVDHEPYEFLVIDVPQSHIGPVMEQVGARRGEMSKMDGKGSYTHLEFSIPTRGLIGLQPPRCHSGRGHDASQLYDYGRGWARFPAGKRRDGEHGLGPGGGLPLDNLQQRGVMFVQPGDEIYEGMIVGEKPAAATWSSTHARKRS